MKNVPALLLICAFGLGGCSAGTMSTDSDEPPATALGEPLQTIQVGAERLQFFDAGDAASILISSTKPNEVPRFAIDVLEQTAGVQLTPLEVFNALAPAGVVPDARLVADHQAQTKALGRPDSSAIEVKFEPPLAEKTISSAQCSNLLLGGEFGTIVRDNLGSINMCTALQPQGSCSVWIQTNRHRVGICNNSTLESALGTATISSEGSNTASTTASVPANTSQLWTGTPALNKTLTGFRRSKMRLEAIAGFSGPFHARLAPN